MAEVPNSECPIRRSSFGTFVVEGADDPAVDIEVPVAATLVSVGDVQLIDPLGETVLAPELRIAVIECVGLDAIVADLAPGVCAAGELGLAGDRIGVLVDGVAIAREAKGVHIPAAKVPAPVGRGDPGKSGAGCCQVQAEPWAR